MYSLMNPAHAGVQIKKDIYEWGNFKKGPVCPN